MARPPLALALAAALAGCAMEAPPRPPPRAWPVVQNFGGGVLAPLRLVTVVSQGDPLQADLEAFGDALVQSQWWTTVGADYGLGAAGPSLHLTGTALTTGLGPLTEQAVSTYITNTIAAAPSPPEPDGRTVYMLFLPLGVPVAGNEKCDAYLLGYHTRFGSMGDNLAVAQRCQFDFASPLEQLTVTASHEVIEAATDPGGNSWGIAPPVPPQSGTPWGLGDGGNLDEVGDLCEGTRIFEGRFAYQRVWSVTAAAAGGDPCVPALPAPYYNVTTDQDWYPGMAGGTAEIPLRGWSTAATGDWGLYGVGVAASDGGTYGVHVKSTSELLVGQGGFASVNDGGQATLLVDLPSTLTSGAWVAVSVESTRSGFGAFPAMDDDYQRPFTIGVYIP